MIFVNFGASPSLQMSCLVQEEVVDNRIAVNNVM